MRANFTEISVKGKRITVPSLQIGDVTVAVEGKWIKIATIKDEFWLEGEIVGNPADIITKLKQGEPKADIFTFSQKLPFKMPKYDYHMEWDNVAAIPLTTFSEWWAKRLPQVTRKNVRRAGKRGVLVRRVDFDDVLVKGIVSINNETPVRQGRPFWHYGKSFEVVKQDYSDFLDRSEFIGAFYRNELIGLLRIIYSGEIANILQLLCMNKHYDKRPANALISEAVALCAQKGASHLVYGKYIYGKNTTSPLTEFKRRNGFEQIFTPTYYVPLTLKGRIFLKSEMHLGIKDKLPQNIVSMLARLRASIYEKGITSPADSVRVNDVS